MHSKSIANSEKSRGTTLQKEFTFLLWAFLYFRANPIFLGVSKKCSILCKKGVLWLKPAINVGKKVDRIIGVLEEDVS